MAILTTRVLENPTVVGRRTVLTVEGNNRLAKVANLTGRKALSLVSNALLRAQVRIQTGLEDAFRLPQLNPAYAFAGTSLGKAIAPVEVKPPTHIYFSAGNNVKGAGEGEVAKELISLISESNAADFGMFCAALKISRSKTMPHTFVAMTTAVSAAATVFSASRENSIFVTIGWGIATAISFTAQMIVLWQLKRSSLADIQKILVDRYKKEEVPETFKLIDLGATEKLNLLIARTRVEEAEKVKQG